MRVVIAVVVAVLTIAIIKLVTVLIYKRLSKDVLNNLGYPNWNLVPYFDETAVVKSRQTLEKYDAIKYFKDNKEKLDQAKRKIDSKSAIALKLRAFLESGEFSDRSQYRRLKKQINEVIEKAEAYRIRVVYISSAGNNLGERVIVLHQKDIGRFLRDPSLLMGKTEYNKLIKEQQKEELDQKHRKYYDKVNKLIDFSNRNRNSLPIKASREQLDDLITQLFDRTVNSIKKIKSVDSEEWRIIDDFLAYISGEIKTIVSINRKLLEYYGSSDFERIKETCRAMMDSQREFNEYIVAKVHSISELFGSRVTRNETINTDEYQYIRPYKKEITPFTAEVSATVFASAENDPLGYVVKYFYPNKAMYPDQIRKLHLLIQELETLREARQIIQRHKEYYRQYLGTVPDYVMEYDEAGFYSRLGFANVDESVLVVEYKFSYTSGGGMAQRSFTIPMTEENIIALIKILEGKLTIAAFAKEQRLLMTKKLRDHIKSRDNYTCCSCGNSVYLEPNLLLEIDHIVPIAKGGCTVNENLQTLCWKCNRSKGDKLVM